MSFLNDNAAGSVRAMPLVEFVGGESGTWHVDRMEPVVGPSLSGVARVGVHESDPGSPGVMTDDSAAAWVVRGVTSNERYTTRVEHESLAASQPPLGRPAATRAALIPVTKSASWWALTQDERRELLEDRSHHIATGQKYLPAVARRLHHGRDLGEPFDFLTWFEYAPEDAGAFEELVDRLRSTPEWEYVEREVDIRLARR